MNLWDELTSFFNAGEFQRLFFFEILKNKFKRLISIYYHTTERKKSQKTFNVLLAVAIVGVLWAWKFQILL